MIYMFHLSIKFYNAPDRFIMDWETECPWEGVGVDDLSGEVGGKLIDDSRQEFGVYIFMNENSARANTVMYLCVGYMVITKAFNKLRYFL